LEQTIIAVRYSAVSVTAIADAVDGDGVLILIEEHTVIAGAEAEQAFELAAERFHIAFAGLSIAMQRDQDAQGCFALDGADLCRHVGLETDSFHSLL